MKLYVLIVVALMGDDPVNLGIFPYTSLEACEAERKKAAAEVLKPPVIPGFDFWTECREVVRDPLKPQSKPLPFGPTPRGGNA